MDNNIIQFVGGPCGQHGPYTFYKAFKYSKNGINRIVTLSEFFFVKLWMDSDLLCIGELQLLWIDKNSEQVLASLRLYFLPENTPEGRVDHGEDEVLAIAEKVVLRVEDLVTWITVDAEWTWGRLGRCSKQVKEPPDDGDDVDRKEEEIKPVSLSESSLDISDVGKEKRLLEEEADFSGPGVVILSYPRYCRYRAMMRRLEGVENEYLKFDIVKALGGFCFDAKNTRIMFCRDTFEYPELEGHEMLCNHLAPKLKGRPRGKRKKRSVSPGSESNESESSVSNLFNAKSKLAESSSSKNGIYVDTTQPRRSTRSTDNSDTKEFIKKLTAFMKMKKTPLGRTPCLGFKEIDLHEFYTKVQKLGGYDTVTSNKLWKTIFEEQNSGSAIIVRRHYERFLLSYERYMRGEEYKPLPVSERRRLKTKSSSKSESEASEGASTGSGSTTPVSSAAPSNAPSPTISGDCKEIGSNIKLEAKTSSLRSVRVKPERQKEKFTKVVKMEEINSGPEPLEIIKVEMKTDDDVTHTIDHTIVVKEEDVKPESPSVVKIECVSNENEPITTAVAPIVQKLESPKNSPSPLECKEDDVPPIIETGDTGSIKDDDNDLVILNVPCDSKTIEEIEKSEAKQEQHQKSDAEDGSSLNNSPPFVVEELKKDKLDILKEGGLEVTPVKLLSPSKDVRPSIIQSVTNNQKKSRSDNKIIIQQQPQQQQMMPSSSSLSVKQHLPIISLPQSLNISKVPLTTTSRSCKLQSSTNNNAPFAAFTSKTPSTPPKVVQSKSIYSYSEKTIYGNPKDCLITNNTYPVHTPKAPVNLKKQTGGDLLDLTITSPQKPIVDNMRIPTIPSSAHPSNNNIVSSNSNSVSISTSSVARNFAKSAALPFFEGRKLGSNLEITLVDSSGKPSSSTSNYHQNHHSSGVVANFPQQRNNNPQSYNVYKSHNKRSSAESSTTIISNNNKMPKVEENGRYNNRPSTSNNSHNNNYYGRQRGRGDTTTHPRPYGSKSAKTETSSRASPNAKAGGFPPGFVFPHYLSQLYDGNKNVPPYFPMIDPLLYTAAMQSIYPQGGHSAPPAPSPFLQFAATQEQLKLYGELMAQNQSSSSSSRMPFPFQLKDGDFSGGGAKKS